MSGPRSAKSRFAIIDIGSNSVRLVVYDIAARAPVLVFNEKVLCGLGRNLTATGKLDPEGIERALMALRRFVALESHIGANQWEVVATAAVRDAEDGDAFLAQAREVCRTEVRLLSGQEEARLSAQGVISGVPNAKGVMGDLGGGSLELAQIGGQAIGKTVTVPLGPLQLMRREDDARQYVDETLATVDWLSASPGESLYVVGGTWRNLARIHMARANYPIRVLHHYTIPAREAAALAKVIEQLGAKSLSRIPDISERRIEALPYGALVMERLLKKMPVKQVVISAYGLREGVLFDRLSDTEKAKDPLIEGCRGLGRRLARFPETSAELKAWTDQLFSTGALGETADEARLRAAACFLGDIGWYVHPDYRAQHSMEQILLAPLVGIDHPGRLFLARVGFHRHEGTGEPSSLFNVAAMVEEQQNKRALILGLAFRLAYTFCAATPGILPHTSLVMEKEKIIFNVPQQFEDLAGEVVRRRLGRLAKTLDLTPQLVVGG